MNNMEKTELLACPFCGEVPVEGYRLGADWHKCESGEVYISCSSPKHEGVCLLVHGENFEQAAKDWNRRTPSPDNKPLTVEELREMDGEPVYLVCEPDADGEQMEMWALVEVDADGGEVYLTNNLGGRTEFSHPEDFDGVSIYRRPPEKGE